MRAKRPYRGDGWLRGLLGRRETHHAGGGVQCRVGARLSLLPSGTRSASLTLVALKDLFDFKPGWPATLGGFSALKNHVVNSYCVFCERMEKRGGAVLLGKTNSALMGFRATRDNYLFGPTRNPFNLAKNSGGPSGGSGAAVADGLLPIAEGTDAGGSIRVPSAWCGTYGFKASFGRVPFVVSANSFGAADSPFLFEGPITRTVEDAAIALNVLAGQDARDPFSIIEPASDFTAATRRSIRGLRIAYSSNLDIFPVDKAVAETVNRAVRVFEEAGAHVEEVKLGIKRSHKELTDAWSALYMLLNLQAFENSGTASICSASTARTSRPSIWSGSRRPIVFRGSISSGVRRSAPRSSTPCKAC
jgi:amidase